MTVSEIGQRLRVEPGMPLAEVPTPALVIDVAKMEANLRLWQEIATSNGKAFRPHVKTHKIPAIALQQLELGARGIAAAKPSEAQVFYDAGIRDIAVAYPTVGPDKWARLAAMARDSKVTVNVDSDHQVRGLSSIATDQGVVLHCQIEIDSGLNRCGIDYQDLDEIEAFARVIRGLPGVELDGVTTHRGKFTEPLLGLTNDEAGRGEGQLVADIADHLRSKGIPVAEVTAGGTITGRGVAQVEGVTEVRAGTYVFSDAMQVAFGSATKEEVAVSVLATVVSTRRPGWFTVDAGSKTFSGDKAVVGAKMPGGDGVAWGIDINATIMRVTEEHGMGQLLDGETVEVGEKRQFMPFHVCTAVNLSNELVAVRDGVVEAVWLVGARGERT